MQRKTLSLCVLFFVCFSLAVFPQSKEKIDLTLNNVTLKYFFFYDREKAGVFIHV